MKDRHDGRVLCSVNLLFASFLHYLIRSFFFQIDDLHKRNKLPVLAGGTTYYAVSVLWEYLVRTETNPELWQINDRRRKVCSFKSFKKHF